MLLIGSILELLLLLVCSLLVLFVPVFLDFLIDVGTQFIIITFILKDSLHQGFENIYEMDLLDRIGVHLNLQVLQQAESMLLFDDNTLGIINKISFV